MIVEAVDFLDRVEAVEFVFGHARPDMSPEVRRREAIIRGLPAGDCHAIEPLDVFPDMQPKPRRGLAECPIWTVRRPDGQLLAAAIGSCRARDLPLRIMGGAVRQDWQGMRVAQALVQYICATEPVVGAAVRHERPDRRKRLDRWGLRFWYESAMEGTWIGFSQPVDPREGLLYASPMATDQEIAAGLARLQTSNRPATIPPRWSHTRC